MGRLKPRAKPTSSSAVISSDPSLRRRSARAPTSSPERVACRGRARRLRPPDPGSSCVADAPWRCCERRAGWASRPDQRGADGEPCGDPTQRGDRVINTVIAVVSAERYSVVTLMVCFLLNRRWEVIVVDKPIFLTVPEVMARLRLSRTTVYEQARLYLATGGAEGLPCRRFGRSLRFPEPGSTAPRRRPLHRRVPTGTASTESLVLDAPRTTPIQLRQRWRPCRRRTPGRIPRSRRRTTTAAPTSTASRSETAHRRFPRTSAAG